jgi:hypothetical protein
MLSWSSQEWVGSRRCDAPGCENESRADHCLVARPTVGPALDIPLCLYYCDEHRDVESLLDRYLELICAVSGNTLHSHARGPAAVGLVPLP